MSFDGHKNLSYSTVATAPAPAASGTSLVVAAGDGAKFPAVPFNATIWPVNTQPTTANAEIVRVTNIATDTFTITRAQESSAARTVIVGDQIAATVTAKSLTDIEGIFTGALGQVFAGAGAGVGGFLGGATLLKSGTGTSAAAGATTVDSIALPTLTALDTLLIVFELESVTQNTAQWLLYSVTDGVSVGLLSPSPLTAGNSSMGITTLMERQGNTTSIMQFMANFGTAAGTLLGNGQYAAVTTAWTATTWTLGLRHGGVTAGGTAKYTWQVWRMAGQ